MRDAQTVSQPDWPSRKLVVKSALGLLVAGTLVYLIGYTIGWGETIDRLETSSLEWVLVACLSTFLCLAAWGKTWHVVLQRIGIQISYRTLAVTFLAATFTNYVTPMGKAGGEPFIAYLLASETDASYEESLASIVVTDLLRLLPFFSIGGFGLGYLVVRASLPGAVEVVAVIFVVLGLALPVATVFGWRGRHRLRDWTLRALEPIATRTDRISIHSVRERIDKFYETVEIIGSSPRALLEAIAYTYLGWILFALPLYFSGLAIGTSVSLLLVCFLVPVSVIAGSTPLPGGIGAIEGTLVVFLVALSSVTAVDALALTTIYRLVSYWLVIAVGGLALLWIISRA